MTEAKSIAVRLPLLLAAALLGPAMSGCVNTVGDDKGTPELLGPVNEVGGDRPAPVYYPEDYADDGSYPLVVLLHGFGANATLQDVIFGLRAQVDVRKFVLITPEGTKGPDGQQYWNATNECCDFFNQEPDDVKYISSVIAEARAHFAIDPTRVALVGHSNGGYMANRYACDQRAGQHEIVTRIVNLAGLSFVDPKNCAATLPIEVLHIHGTADERVFYESNVTDPSLSNPDVVEDDLRLRAGAFELAQSWAAKAKCASTKPNVDVGAYDLSDLVGGAETDTLAWPGCTFGSSTLLRANGVGHVWLDANDEMRRVAFDFALGTVVGEIDK